MYTYEEMENISNGGHESRAQKTQGVNEQGDRYGCGHGMEVWKLSGVEVRARRGQGYNAYALVS